MTSRKRLRELAEVEEPRAGLLNLFFVSAGEGVTELFLIRHAQIQPSETVGGDLELTDLGREQAEVLAGYLAGYKFDAVYSSPTRRAQQTAAPLAARQGLDVALVHDLRDVEQRRPIDKPLPELIAEVTGPEGVEAFIERMKRGKSFDAFAPFVESSDSFRRRVAGAVEQILAAHSGGGRVAVFTHAPVIISYIAHLAGASREFFINPKLTSMTRILARGEDRTVDFVNATPHFGVL